MEWLKEAEKKAGLFVKDYDKKYLKVKSIMNINSYVNGLFALRKALLELINFEKSKYEHGIKEYKCNNERLNFSKNKYKEIEEEIISYEGRKDLDLSLNEIIKHLKIEIEKNKNIDYKKETEIDSLYKEYQEKIINCKLNHTEYKMSSKLLNDNVSKMVSNGLDRFEDNAFNYLRNIAKYKQERAIKKGFKENAVLEDSACLNNLNVETIKLLQDSIQNNIKNAMPIMNYLHDQVDGVHLKTLRRRFVGTKLDLENEVSYDIKEALLLIGEAFKGVSDDMFDFLCHMVKNNYIDYKDREFKRTGACAKNYQELFGHSVVVMSYTGSIDDVLTLAHELGHCYHNNILKKLDAGYREYPLVLGETVSMFSESIVLESLLKKHKGSNLEKSLEIQKLIKFYDLTIMVPSRFDLEEKIYDLEERNRLDSDSFQLALIENQEKWNPLHNKYDNYNSWMLVKHYFMPNFNFYNYPYYFGYLINSLFLEKKAMQNFNKKFESFIRATGEKDINSVFKEIFNEDLNEHSFWEKRLEKITNDSLVILKKMK